MKEEYSRNPSPKLLKDIQEAKKHIPQLQGQLFRPTGATQVNYTPPANKLIASMYFYTEWVSRDSDLPETSHQSLHKLLYSVLDRSRQTLILILSKD